MIQGGSGIEVRVTATSDALRKLGRQLGDRRQANQALANQMSSWVARNFDAEGALGQTPWAALAPSTAKAKLKKYGALHILEGSGFLRASFSRFGYDNDSATVGSDVLYSKYHEEGGEHLPRRPMLPPPDVALRDAVDVYQLFIDRARGSAGL